MRCCFLSSHITIPVRTKCQALTPCLSLELTTSLLIMSCFCHDIDGLYSSFTAKVFHLDANMLLYMTSPYQ